MLLLLLALGCSDKGGDTSGGDTNTGITGDATNGATLFDGKCAGCHNADGSGGNDIGGTPSADLTVRVPALTDAELETTISEGFGTAMGSQYTDAQDIADVIAYLRATFG